MTERQPVPEGLEMDLYDMGVEWAYRVNDLRDTLICIQEINQRNVENLYTNPKLKERGLGSRLQASAERDFAQRVEACNQALEKAAFFIGANLKTEEFFGLVTESPYKVNDTTS